MTYLFAWLIADFISGVVHWWEDRSSTTNSSIAFLNQVRLDNERHHKMPGYLTRYSWWSNINTTAPFAWTAAVISFFLGAPDLMWLVLFFLGFGNLVHRWAHDSKSRRPYIVRVLQAIGLLISENHHAGHHFEGVHLVKREESRYRFCVMSNWLNPWLDAVDFWGKLERLLHCISGKKL
jgi:hypothetical protein